MPSKDIYLDYAATTPVDPEVLKAMLPYFGSNLSALSSQLSAGLWGNPGSLHQFGQRASAAVFQARQAIAKALDVHYSEIVFTGSATEANNLALKGAFHGWHDARNSASEIGLKKIKSQKPKIILSAFEHDSVLEVAYQLGRWGADLVFLPISKNGQVDIGSLEKEIDDRTILISVMYANNEVGSIQPIRKIAELVKKYRAAHPKTHYGEKNWWPLLHTDAVQSFQYLPCKPKELGVDLMTLSAHKIYGPKGIGLLYVPNVELNLKRGAYAEEIFPIQPLIDGGGQENNLRSGTENVAGIAGFAKAVELVEKTRIKESKRISILQNYLWHEIKKIFPKAILNGPAFAKASAGKLPLSANGYRLMANGLSRLPNNLNFYIPGQSAEEAIVKLDLQGIAISTGPACSARALQASHVLKSMGTNDHRAKNSLRITLGKPTTKSELTRFLAALKNSNNC